MDKKYTIDQLRQVKGIGEKTIQRIIEQFDESEYVSEYDPNIHIEPNTLVQGDMLEVMNGIQDKSIDMILTDLPYGTTASQWDTIIDFDKMWKQYERVIKDNGAIVLFGSEPFSSKLVISNIDLFKYEWIWIKDRYNSGFAHAKNKPLKKHENILVFSKGFTIHEGQSDNRMNYFPQGLKPVNIERNNTTTQDSSFGKRPSHRETIQEFTNYPISRIKFDLTSDDFKGKALHPTQKPVSLLEYLIKTYTKEGDVVLDSTMGSGSTCVAAKNTNRKYIGIELDEEYFETAKERVNKC